MNRFSIITRLFAAAVIAIAACACSTSRKAATPATPPEQSNGWTRVRVPLTVRLEQPMAASIGGTAVMVRDTCISLSMRFFGMEVMAVQIDGDSAVVVDRMHKQYLAENLSSLLAKIPFTVGTLQEVLMGQSIEVPPGIVPPGVDCTILEQNGLINSMSVTGGGKDVKLTFSDPAETPHGTMASRTMLEVSGKRKLKATLEWNWNKARWGSEVEYRPIRLSPSYKRMNVKGIDLDKLLPQN